MPYFQVRLATDAGDVVSQLFLAPSVQDCRRHFEATGYCILSIKRDWKRIQIPALPFEQKIKDKDFIMVNQELVALIKAGYPILKSIEIIIKRTKNIHLKELLMKVEDEVRSGKSLSDAFSTQGQNFSTVYIASLMAGERSGNLAGTITRFIAYQKTITQTKAKIKTAMTYPTILIIFSAMLLTVLVSFVIPRFATFFGDFDSELPGITKAIMAFSNVARSYIHIFLLVIVIGVLVFAQMRRREETRVWLDHLKLRIPYARTIWTESAVSQFSRTLGLLLEGGISLLSSLSIARRAVPNRWLAKKMEGLPDLIKNGEGLSDSIAKSGFFTPLSLDMIRIGESSANLEGMLADVAEVYDERIQAKIDSFVSMLTPIIIIFLGAVVAVMLLSVYLPIFQIIQVTR
jgi:type IV pilus assembly protein PilC